MGAASAVLALVRNISGAFGVALFATILSASIGHNILATAAHSFVTNPALKGTLAALIILKSQIAAYDYVFLIASLLTAFGGIASLFMRLEHKEEKPGEPVFAEA